MMRVKKNGIGCTLGWHGKRHQEPLKTTTTDDKTGVIWADLSQERVYLCCGEGGIA